jgi:hypothetical protein
MPVRRKLSSVTLVAVDTLDSNRASRVLTYCSRFVEFADAILFASQYPTIEYSHGVTIIADLDYAGVQQWELTQLHWMLSTPFCLNVQHDGWILNPELWMDEFLEYDYIGAPWPRQWGTARVGNSGFSLRSKRFCQATAAVASSYSNEGYDVFACRVMESRFKQRGIRYAPLELAALFSWEFDCDDLIAGPTTAFGFHGWNSGRCSQQYERMLHEELDCRAWVASEWR